MSLNSNDEDRGDVEEKCDCEEGQCGEGECECHGCNEEKEMDDALSKAWYRFAPIRNALIAGVMASTVFVASLLNPLPNYFTIPLYLISMGLGGFFWIKEGLAEVVYEHKIGIGLLMLAATLGSAFLGLWEEAAFLVFLYGAAEGVEEYTYFRTRGSIRALMDRVPKEATLLVEGKERTTEATKLRVDDVFLVRPGESIATDGIITKGESSVDESSVTGESLPISKREGMKVLAGTLNIDGMLEIRSSASFEDNTVSKIIHLVEEAQERKGRVQQFIERFGNIYSPIVLVSGILLMTIPFLFTDGNPIWFERAIVFLVAAAPCALVMSTPVAIAAGIGRSGKKGVLIKGGVNLENLGKIKAVAFDKTGTLTNGKPIVANIFSFNGDERNLIRLAYSVEKCSEHPIARAIVEKALSNGIEAGEMSCFKAVIGLGATAVVEDREIFVGNPDYFTGSKNIKDGMPILEKFRSEGKIVIFVGTRSELLGMIALKDQVRPEAKRIVGEIHDMGLKVVMLTGDSQVNARAIATELGIDDVRADMRPEDKIQVIRDLKTKFGPIAMVGDGINDAPALAEADVGIAMGAAGTDAAIEAADVALMADELDQIPHALRMGRSSNKISNQNIAFSMIVLAVLIPSALFGLLSIALAVVLHESSELLAVANGLRTGNGD